jgi:hypothetical protein
MQNQMSYETINVFNASESIVYNPMVDLPQLLWRHRNHNAHKQCLYFAAKAR